MMTPDRNRRFEASMQIGPYQFWLPDEDQCVRIGPNRDEVPLPLVPLPIKAAGFEAGEAPSDALIGESVYEYLRRYPDCQYNREYAELLRDGFPHYISDLASQAVMLSQKDVAAPYLKRLVSYLKILLLLDPENQGLLQQLGLQSYRLAMNFEALGECREQLIAARSFLLRAEQLGELDPAARNHLAQIAYLFGDYAAAQQQWEALHEELDDPAVRGGIEDRLAELRSGNGPDQPLIEELEDVGEAMRLYGEGDRDQARLRLERIEEQGALCRRLPLAEFHYLLGMYRLQDGEQAAAFESFEAALQINPDYEPAEKARESILNQGG